MEGYADELEYLREEIEKTENHIILTSQEHRKLELEWKIYQLENQKSESKSRGNQPY